MNDFQCRLAMVRKLQAMSLHFGQMMSEDSNAMVAALPKKELDGFLRMSQNEFQWFFDVKSSRELDPFIREGVAIVCSMHHGVTSAVDLFVVTSSLAHVLYEHAMPKRSAKATSLTFSKDEVEAMVAEIEYSQMAS